MHVLEGSKTALRGFEQNCTIFTSDIRSQVPAFIEGKSHLKLRPASGDVFDANNLRVSVQDATGSKRLLLDGMEEAAEYLAGVRAARYDHDPSRVDSLLGQDTGATKVYAFNDALGSVYGLTDTTSAEVSRYGYDAYGARTPSAEAVATKFGFTGRVHDGGGLNYNRARYLDSGIGRFIASDPLNRGSGSSGGIPTSPMLTMMAPYVQSADEVPGYVYTRNAPTVGIDPTGLVVFSGSVGGIGGIAYPWGGWAVEGGAVAAIGFGNKGFTQGSGYFFGGGVAAGLAVIGSTSLDFGMYWGLDTVCELAGPFGELGINTFELGFSLVWTIDTKLLLAAENPLAALEFPIGFQMGIGLAGIPLPNVRLVVTYTKLVYANGCCSPGALTL